MKKAAMILALVGIMTISFSTAGYCSIFTGYYKNNPTTVDQLTKTWGNPIEVRKSADGTETYVFKNEDSYIKYRHFVVRNNVVVDSGLGR